MKHHNDQGTRLRDQYGRWVKDGIPSSKGQTTAVNPVEKAKSIGYTDAEISTGSGRGHYGPWLRQSCDHLRPATR